MADQYTIDDVIEFANEMSKKGFYTKKSNKSRISSLNNIVTVLGDEEKNPDYILGNLENILNRWGTSVNAAPQSIIQAKSNIKAIVSDFLEYKKDPQSFKPRTKTTKKTGEKKKKEPDEIKPNEVIKQPEIPKQKASKDVSFNINIQIHISADATNEQIEKIFESMSKHLNIGDNDK